MTIPKTEKTRKAKKILTKKEWQTVFADIQSAQITDWKTANTIIQNRRRES